MVHAWSMQLVLWIALGNLGRLLGTETITLEMMFENFTCGKKIAQFIGSPTTNLYYFKDSLMNIDITFFIVL